MLTPHVVVHVQAFGTCLRFESSSLSMDWKGRRDWPQSTGLLHPRGRIWRSSCSPTSDGPNSCCYWHLGSELDGRLFSLSPLLSSNSSFPLKMNESLRKILEWQMFVRLPTHTVFCLLSHIKTKLGSYTYVQNSLYSSRVMNFCASKCKCVKTCCIFQQTVLSVDHEHAETKMLCFS